MKPSRTESSPSPRSWPREWQLLVCCGQVRDTTSNESRIDELLSDVLDWNKVLGAACNLGMLSLLAIKLETHPSGKTPPEIRAVLRQLTRALHARSLQSVGELFALLDLFTSHGLQVLPFKGPVLAAQAYGGLSFRPFADLDLLVKPEDVPAACDLLVSRQYTPRYAMSADQRANLIHFGCEYPFQRVRIMGLIPRKDDVDLHWNLFPPSFPIAFDPHELWDRTETVALGQRQVATINTNVLVFYLCAHGYAHHWSRLEWISALARLIAARPGIDWAWIRQEAVQTGAETVLGLGLVLANQWMGAPVPADLLAEARNRPAMETLLQHVTARVLRDPAQSTAPESTLNEELFFDLEARENWRRRVSYFLRRLITPSLEDVEWVSVPARLPVLYYFLRPLRLSLRYLHPQPSRTTRWG